MKTFKKYYNSLVHHQKHVAKEFIFETTSLLFVKISPSKVNCYEMSNWGLKDQPMASLYQSHFKLHYWPYKQNRLVRNYLSTVGKFSLNWSHGYRLVTFANGSKSVFFKGMKIKYTGRPKKPYPKKRVQESKTALNELRARKNAFQRLYYHRKKAAERFEAAAVFEDDNKRWQTPKYVDVSQLPMDDVFKLQNVSHRRYIIDYYGMDTILAGLESTVIDSDLINGNAYELLEVIIPFSNGEDGERDQIGTYLRMVNPSTDEIHFEGVPNYNKYFASDSDRQWARDNTILSPTVRAALAWRDNETKYTIPIKLT
jgi:hypothetical protein